MTVVPVSGEVEAVEVIDNKREEEQEPEGPDYIVEGPPMPADFKVHEKKLKEIVKEGGKKGVEIEGASDMGGLKFFCTVVEKPAGDVTLLIESMKAMNAKSDPTEEERKGGAGKIGKMILSMTEEVLALVAYVPSNYSDECPAKEWLESIVQNSCPSQKAAAFSACGDVSTNNYYACLITGDKDQVFPIKVRDPAISNAYNFLRKKGLFPEDDEDDDDDYVFGDEDFPSM